MLGNIAFGLFWAAVTVFNTITAVKTSQASYGYFREAGRQIKHKIKARKK